MKCEDCLALIEEYFDGELYGPAAERVSAHLAACAECADALEALSAEQAVYLSYERDLEVTPALWERVRAEVARLEPAAETVPAPNARPAHGRLRAKAAAVIAALTLRPAYASSLALLVIGVTVGGLWYGKSTDAPPALHARNEGAAPVARINETAKAEAESNSQGQALNPQMSSGAASVGDDLQGGDGQRMSDGADRLATRAVRTGAAPRGVGTETRAGRAAGEATSVEAATSGEVASALAPPPVDHLKETELAGVLMPASFDDEDPVADAARLLDPEEKEVARHVERAQMLLRSFKNARVGEDATTASVAYEKELSRKLLEENVALRLEAEAAGDKTTRRVLDTIQPFLLDIANMRDNPSRDEVRSIKERMRRTEIIAALQVY
jgi:hypothetical protein